MRAFVLVELLIALAILSVLFFYLTPKTVDIFKTQQNANAEKLNLIVKAAYKKAKITGVPQMIWGIKGSNNVRFDKKLYNLTKDVFSSTVNGEYQSGAEYKFLIYPSGIMDRVALSLYGNIKLVSQPLLLRFEIE